MSASELVDLGALYGGCRERLSALVLEPGVDVTTPVAACPGWVVRDVVAHLVGVIEDAYAGRLDGSPPGEDLTAAAVTRHAGETIEDLVATWTASAPLFERVLTGQQIWAAMLDVLSHEHDVRHALGRPGARDDVAVQLGARRLATAEGLPAQIVVDDDVAAPDDRRPTVRTSAFEVLRFRLGRRSVDQVRALPWSEDPAPILDELFVFGPRVEPLVE